MNLWLLDASVLLASEDSDDQHHRDAVRLLNRDDPLATLDLAYYEVANVAVRAWRDPAAADRLRARVAALADDGGLERADPALLASATAIAGDHGISVYDAAYVAAARRAGAVLVSCDVRDLVSRGLARVPAEVIGT
ncbi:PIN domain-containing protein [Raineyella sp. W15-4]|uniref:PIN domain-containing protein n=1 Tax=Raineyella sp. W15-4 TaxID=3081651 RepID=UPI0029530621|nr:PIN domain-containing protein [Raineyella sp. W15-4]WOQ17497.1 PIN domain-containing protein [Raineyella sp. W15-4]